MSSEENFRRLGLGIIMPRYTPYGLSEDDLTEPHTKVMPERVQKLIDLYHKRNYVKMSM